MNQEFVGPRKILQWGIIHAAVTAWAVGLVLCLSGLKTPGIQAIIWRSFLSAVILTACITLLKKQVFDPLEELSDIIIHWSSTTREELEKQMMELIGSARELGKVFYEQMDSLEQRLSTVRELTREETTREVQLEIADTICQAALPLQLPEYPGREFFAVAGLTRPGQKKYCSFYDCFYVDTGLLGVAVGQITGQSINAALSLALARMEIRTQLRLGCSVAEALSDINVRLFAYGVEEGMQVLAGLLDTGTGQFSFINTGICEPLLMCGGKQYEWIDRPVCIPLGKDQHAIYHADELKLHQGDRLFLCTDGLPEMQNREGAFFRNTEMRTALNRTRACKEPEQSLRNLADEAAAFCSADQNHPGYSALLLEYRQDKEIYSSLRVLAQPENTGKVRDFLKRNFEQNGLHARNYAPAAVLADELFILCCRRLEEGGELTVECGINPENSSITIHFSGAFQGQDPLAEGQSGPSGQAADYIRSHAVSLNFEVGAEQDVITVICKW